MGSLTRSCLWGRTEISYDGLCHHSPLSEVVPPFVMDVFEDETMPQEWQAARVERTKKGQENKRIRNATVEAGETRAKYALTDKGKEVRRGAVTKYEASDKGKEGMKAWGKTDIGKAHHQRAVAAAYKKYGVGGSAPDQNCEGKPTNFKTKPTYSMNRHKKICPVHV